MPIEFVRDQAMYAAIFGFFATVWLGWAQEAPPKTWRLWLGMGSAAAILTCITGIWLAAAHWDGATALTNSSYPVFGVIVASEVLLVGLGATVLAHFHKKDYLSAWIAVIVGAHFVPLVWIFKDRSLAVLAALLCAVTVVALWRHRKWGIALSALVGGGVGVLLLAFAIKAMLVVITG
jgi:hypothetical protein